MSQVTVRQWFALPKAERDRRAAEFHAASAALQLYRSPDGEETDTYLILSARVAALWTTVPWWCRR